MLPIPSRGSTPDRHPKNGSFDHFLVEKVSSDMWEMCPKILGGYE